MRIIRPYSTWPSPWREKNALPSRPYAGQWKPARGHASIWILAVLLLLLQIYAPLHTLSHIPNAFHTTAPHHEDEHPRADGICPACLALCGIDYPLASARLPAVVEASSFSVPPAGFGDAGATRRHPPRCRAPPGNLSGLL